MLHFLFLFVAILPRISKPHELHPQMGRNVTFDLPFVDCYFVLEASVASFDEAAAACRSKGGAGVALFRTNSQFHAYISQVDWDGVPGFAQQGKWVGQLWTGFSRSSPTRHFQWMDGSEIDLDHFKSAVLPGDDAISQGRPLNCALTRQGGLVPVSCGETNKTAGVLCQTTTYDKELPKSILQTKDNNNFCKVLLLPSGPSVKNVVSMPGYVRKTFFNIEGYFTWKEAFNACQSNTDISNRGLNSSLAVISSVTEYQLLRSEPKLLTFQSDGYWVGLRRHPDGLGSPKDQNGIGAAFIWLDDTPLNYFAFIPGKPMKNSGAEKCVAIMKDQKMGSIGYSDYRCLVANENGEIPDWDDEIDSEFGALCQYATEWL